MWMSQRMRETSEQSKYKLECKCKGDSQCFNLKDTISIPVIDFGEKGMPRRMLGKDRDVNKEELWAFVSWYMQKSAKKTNAYDLLRNIVCTDSLLDIEMNDYLLVIRWHHLSKAYSTLPYGNSLGDLTVVLQELLEQCLVTSNELESYQFEKKRKEIESKR